MNISNIAKIGRAVPEVADANLSGTSKAVRTLVLAAMMAAPAVGAAAQEQGVDGNVLTTVYAPEPPAFEELAQGPDVEGFISARQGNRIQVTDPSGQVTTITVTDRTSIKARGGFLGLGRETLTAASLFNGLPVEVATRSWDGGLVAEDVRFSGEDLETAQMIASGTDQRFTSAETAIEENAIATEELRGRFGDIDQYNVKSTTNVYFDSGRSTLSAQARTELCDAAAQADQTDNALLLVVGYTDSDGSQELNQALSEKRAGNVVNFLQQQCGWAPYRMLTPTGMSESNPVADNTTAFGKQQNRRVAVNVLVSKSVDGFADDDRRTARR
ncbi:OmpA family protein [Erythrobacter sp.]|jgi:outer membrane protein OmpA-like peptidoglycan-associated protein|uniref:OmpA family protein n=1 Tax=Erythrobacter sp. TaxID=1042 RepID=UPI002EBFDF15|nr:OmpA family protein [Erythrobacter sp.]